MLGAIKFALKNFKRNFWLSVATISLVTLALLSINIFVIINFLSDEALGFVQNRIDISLYLKSDAAQDNILSLKAELEKLPEVKEVKLISKEQALASFQALHKDDALLQKSLEELSTNPLGASFSVKANSLKDYQNILDSLDGLANTEIIQERNFNDYHDLISKLQTIAGKTKDVSMIVTAIFAVIAVLVIFNTVRMAIHTQRDEIGVMKLVGATDSFVRYPYVVEIGLYALIALLLTIAVIYSVITVAQPYLVQLFGGYPIDIVAYFNNNFIKIFGIQILALALLTAISSWIAMRKFLKV